MQEKFSEDAGVGSKEEMSHFNLVPLETWRDIAMLGVIHRTCIGKGPTHFKEFFKPSRERISQDPRGSLGQTGLVQRLALGLVAVYNLLHER